MAAPSSRLRHEIKKQISDVVSIMGQAHVMVNLI